MWLLKSWTHALKTCDEDIASSSFFSFSFSTVANLNMLPRPMLFPTTPMISVSTNKIKKIYSILLLQIRGKFLISVSTKKKIKTYFIIITLIIIIILIINIIIIIIVYFKSKTSLCLRFSQTKIRICFIFLPSLCFRFPQIKIKIYFIFYFKSKPSHKLIWLSPTLFLEKV